MIALSLFSRCGEWRTRNCSVHILSLAAAFFRMHTQSELRIVSYMCYDESLLFMRVDNGSRARLTIRALKLSQFFSLLVLYFFSIFPMCIFISNATVSSLTAH